MRGLSGIILHDITVVSCPRCGYSELAVPAIEELRHAIARAIVAKRQRLMPREIRFLRKQLGLSGIDLATHLGATPESVSRWEHGRTPMGVTADRLLRLMVVVAQGTAYSLNALRVVARHEPRATPLHVRWHDGAWEAIAA
jgi:putative zinc finger/helix-turn-helix YgiT family protein